MSFQPAIPIIPKDVEAITKSQASLILPRFTTDDAWQIGTALRNRLLNHPKPALISICLANSNFVVFQAVNHAGAGPDNTAWISRKVATVLRFGVSSWFMHAKMKGDEAFFASKWGFSPEQASTYAIHGGAVPVYVEGVDGLVAVVSVSGLAQEEDHGVVVEALTNFKNGLAA